MRVPPMTLVVLSLAACDAPTLLRPLHNAVPSTANAGAPVHMVTGGGQLIGETFKETYGISARKDAEGNVSGQVEMHIDGVPPLHGTVTCLQVDGTSAWIGGVVTASQNIAEVPLGTEFWFRVQDNGNGQDEVDRISTIRLGFLPAATCNERRPVQVPWLLERGNLVVR